MSGPLHAGGAGRFRPVALSGTPSKEAGKILDAPLEMTGARAIGGHWPARRGRLLAWSAIFAAGGDMARFMGSLSSTLPPQKPFQLIKEPT